jgi:hypothetical protein
MAGATHPWFPFGYDPSYPPLPPLHSRVAVVRQLDGQLHHALSLDIVELPPGMRADQEVPELRVDRGDLSGEGVVGDQRGELQRRRVVQRWKGVRREGVKLCRTVRVGEECHPVRSERVRREFDEDSA